jgi:rubredoxin
LFGKKDQKSADEKRICPSCNAPGLVRKISIPSLVFIGLTWYAIIDTALRYSRGREGVYTGIFAIVLFGAIGVVLWPAAGFRCKKCGALFNPGNRSKS